jgi:hypothetical protein
VSQSAPPHIRRNTSAETDSPTVEDLMRDASVILLNCGVKLSRPKTSVLVRRYKAQVEHNGWAFFDYMANAMRLSQEVRRAAARSPEVAQIIGYHDPTGEQAVRNVLRGQQ